MFMFNNLMRLLYVVVFVCYVRPMDEDSTIQHTKRSNDERGNIINSYNSNTRKLKEEHFRNKARGQQSQQPPAASYPPSSSLDTATASATQHSTAHTATETNAIAQRRSLLDIILPKTNRNYPKRLTVINRKWEHESTSGKARLMPKVFSVKRNEILNHQLPGKLEQFEFGDGTGGEFSSSHGKSADTGKRMSDVGGKSLLSQILLATSNKRKSTVSSRKRRSIEDGNSGSELPSGEEEEESGETSSGQESLLPESPLPAHNLTAPETPENSSSKQESLLSQSPLPAHNLTAPDTPENSSAGQGQESELDPSGSESAGNEASSVYNVSESLVSEDEDASASQPSGQTGSGTTLSGHDSSSSGYEISGPESSTGGPLTDASSGSTVSGDSPSGHTPSAHSDPTSPGTTSGISPLAVNGEDVCNTCRIGDPAKGVEIEFEFELPDLNITQEYAKTALFAKQSRAMTDYLMAKEKQSADWKRDTSPEALDQEQQNYRLPWNPTISPRRIRRMLSTNPGGRRFRTMRREQRQEFWLPWRTHRSLRRRRRHVSKKEREERYIRNQYTSLAVSLAYFRLSHQDEQKLKAIYNPRVDEFHKYEVQGLQRLLCQLDTLPWRRGFSCELGMRKYSISTKFLTADRGKQFHRNIVLFDYIRRTVGNIERFFTHLYEEAAAPTQSPTLGSGEGIDAEP